MAVFLTEIQQANGKVAVLSDGSVPLIPASIKDIIYQTQGGGIHQFKVGTLTIFKAISSGLVTDFATAGNSTDLKIEHVDNTNASSNARLIVRSGGGSGGDALLGFQLGAVQDWAFGVDNSDSDKVKLSASATLGTTDRLSVQVDGVIATFNAHRFKRTSITVTTTLDDTYFYVGCNQGAAITINLPTAVNRAGQIYIIKDEVGNAGTNNITIDPNGAETIDGASTNIINANRGFRTIISDGANWHIVSTG